MKNIVLIFMCILNTGCAQYITMARIAIPPGEFSYMQMESIANASADWCDAGADCIPVEIDRRKRGGAIMWVNNDDRCDGDTQAYTNLQYYRAPQIRLCPKTKNVTPEKLRWIVRHELGHAMTGREDHLNGEHTMQENATGNDPGITTHDLEYVTKN